jgi:hypothetical protein
MTSAPVLFSTHQHAAPFALHVLASFAVLGTIAGAGSFVVFESATISGGAVFAAFVLCYWYRHFFHARSQFVITPDKLSMDVRNGFFSRYDMSIHFDQIKDLAYSKNHFLHYAFDYGVLFVRSSAGADGNFVVSDIPRIEEVYALVNRLYGMTPEERRSLRDGSTVPALRTRQESETETIKRVRRELVTIPGIKEAEVLSDEDRRFIFENEEDRNHGVYECVRRKIVFAATHDARLRAADAPIVLRLGSKTVFPPVSFHELREKNVVSSSPGVRVHEYLVKKFQQVDEYDATLLIGFDL